MVKDTHSADSTNDFTEKIEIAGENLVATVKNLMSDARAASSSATPTVGN